MAASGDPVVGPDALTGKKVEMVDKLAVSLCSFHQAPEELKCRKISSRDWLSKVQAGASFADFLVRTVHEPVSPIRGALSAG